MAYNSLDNVQTFLGFPVGSASKESACNAGDLGSIPGLGRSAGEGNSYPLQYSGLKILFFKMKLKKIKEKNVRACVYECGCIEGHTPNRAPLMMYNLDTQFAVSQDLRPWASPFAPVASDPYAKKGSWVSRSLNPLPILNAINLYYLLLFKMLKNQTKFNMYFLRKVVFIGFIKSKEWENENSNSIEISDFYMFRVNGVMYHKYVLVGKVYSDSYRMGNGVVGLG